MSLIILHIYCLWLMKVRIMHRYVTFDECRDENTGSEIQYWCSIIFIL